MKLARQALLAFSLLLPLPAAARGDGGDELFSVLAKGWLERHAEESASDGWSGLLDRRFGRIAVGVFDVRVPPAALRDADGARSTGAALVALLDAQAGWAAWVEGRAPQRPSKDRKDDPVAKWLLGWNARLFAGRETEGADLVDVAQAPAPVRAALERLRAEQLAGAPLGLATSVAPVRLVLFPARPEFVEFVCVAGATDPRLTASAWSESLHTWLEYTADDTRFLTLEYGPDDAKDVAARGTSIGARDSSAIGQLVTQVSVRTLLASVHRGRLDPALASAMANALVVDLYGEIDTRIDGDVRTRSTSGSSTFVPGGNSAGGVLPQNSAENRWRGTKGRDHFLGILALVQKQGGKKGKTRPERLSGFELHSDDGGTKVIVRAPFLGSGAVAPPAEVLPDYLELVRSYGVAFLHWLRVAGAGEPDASAARFGELLRALGTRTESEELARVFEELYGQPLSAADTEALFASPTLEGRFLASLAK